MTYKIGKTKLKSSGREVEAYRDKEGNRFMFIKKRGSNRREKFYF